MLLEKSHEFSQIVGRGSSEGDCSGILVGNYVWETLTISLLLHSSLLCVGMGPSSAQLMCYFIYDVVVFI